MQVRGCWVLHRRCTPRTPVKASPFGKGAGTISVIHHMHCDGALLTAYGIVGRRLRDAPFFGQLLQMRRDITLGSRT